MVKTICLIPARSGSKSIKNKNILNLGGIPLLAWSIRASKMSKKIQQTIVSTDSKNYANIAKKFGAQVPFIRPKNLSTNFSEDTSCVLHCIKWLEKKNQIPDFIVHLRPTTPFRKVNIIDKAISIFQKNKKANSLRSVHEMSETAYKTLEKKNDFLKLVFNQKGTIDKANGPRQKYPKTYFPNGYVDIFRVKDVLNSNMLYGKRSLFFLTPEVTELDNLANLNYLKFQLKNNKL